MRYVHTLLGKHITLTEAQDKQWDPATRKYVQPDPITRAGMAWSAGPADDTVRVLPDQRRSGEGQAVCVHATRKTHTVRPIDHHRSSTEMQAALARPDLGLLIFTDPGLEEHGSVEMTILRSSLTGVDNFRPLRLGDCKRAGAYPCRPVGTIDGGRVAVQPAIRAKIRGRAMRVRGWVAAAVVACSALTGFADEVAFAALPAAPAQVPPYEREEFGDGWFDLDGDGCDTRQEVLARDLVVEQLDPDGCRVLTGTLHDPYTGRTIAFRRGLNTSDDVQIDHVVPLAYAWRAGAWAWTDAEREEFANDPVNLQATDGPTNNRKGDDGPSRWLPPNPDAHCDYATRWVQVLQAHQLPATPADAARLDELTASCPAR